MKKNSKVYQIITECICNLLKQGEIPWQHPWKTPGIFPQNMISQRSYSGINAFLLAWAGFQVPYFLTFNQVRQLGGMVKKGEKSTPVVFWKFIEKKKTESGKRQEASTVGADNHQPGNQSAERGKDTIPFLRYYSVFNIGQVSGIEDKIPPLEKPNGNYSPIEKAEQILAGMTNPPKIQHIKKQAYYDHENDVINIPAPEWFESTEHYFATLWHELIHATGHHSRLNRRKKDEKRSFGDDAYSKEELIAEMGSAFLCAQCNISKPTLNNAAAYIQSWLKAFEDDQTMLVSAAGKAQKAVEFILGEKESNA